MNGRLAELELIGLNRSQNSSNSSRNDDISGFLLLLDEIPAPKLNHQIMSDTERCRARSEATSRGRVEVERCLFALTGTPGLEIKEQRKKGIAGLKQTNVFPARCNG